MKIEQAPGKLQVGFRLLHAALPYSKIHAVLTSEDYLIGIIEDSKNITLVISRHDRKPLTIKDDMNPIKDYAIANYKLPRENQLTEIPSHQDGITRYFTFAKP